MSRGRLARSLVAAAAFVMTISLSASPQVGSLVDTARTAGFTPVADAFVNEAKPDKSYGRDANLRTDASPATYRSYLRFDVAGTSGTITSAVLRLYAGSSNRTGYEVRSVSDQGWDEASITYANAPEVGLAVGTSGGFGGGTWTTVDVTPLVASSGIVDLALTSTSHTMTRYASRESGHAAPRLLVTTDGTAPPIGPAEPSSGAVRAAFYYGWFPEAWTQRGTYPYTNYTPSAGFYDSGSLTVVQEHIRAMQYGHIDAGIASWWGQGSRTDGRVPVLLQAAGGTGFRWSLYYEPEGYGDPSSAQIEADLNYIRDRYASDPGFLRLDGRFVVFVYGDANDGCAMADRWARANTAGAYVVLKVFPGYRSCPGQPQGWHQYAPAVAADDQAPYSYSISPGFWLKGTDVRLGRDLARWTQSVRDMAASGAQFELVTTFNEWGEGTSVESAREWATPSGFGAYLDALHDSGAPTPLPVASSIAPPTPSGTPSPTETAPPPSPSASPSATPSAPEGPSADPVIAAAGDIACDPASSSFNGGSGTTTACRQKATSDLLLQVDPTAVLPLGDIQYEDGTLDKYLRSYDPSWGRLKAITRPAIGNHEYLTPGAAGYFDYFGAAAGERSQGYYSFDVGRWHLIALNSNCSHVGGCGAGSAQERWLRADLAAHPVKCTLAYWHHPRFSSGQHGSSAAYRAFWQALWEHDADVVLNGHDHDYERFAPQDPNGAADQARGIRQFVVGTGGKNHYGFTAVQPNSEVRNSDTYGVLALTLHGQSYDYRFIPEVGKSFTDAGTGSCH